MKLDIFRDFKKKFWLFLVIVSCIGVFKVLLLFFPNPEGFYSTWLDTINKKRTESVSSEEYPKAIGYMYLHPTESGDALNAIKSVLFSSSSCNWRSDWTTHMSAPMGATDPAQAKTSLLKWLQCVQDGGNKCIEQVVDFNKRFFISGCNPDLPMKQGSVDTVKNMKLFV
jgi:hypothetical protein